MVIIFANSTTTHMGGVEIFNEELEDLFQNKNVKYYRANSSMDSKPLNYIIRIVKTLLSILKNYNKTDYILVQYGNFLDILSLPLLKMSFKNIRVIAHVGDSWKHIENNKLKFLTNILLRYCTQIIYIITDEQRNFLKHNKIIKIHTIINEKYIKKQKIKNKEEKYLLYLGRICKEKGIDDLINAYSKLNKTMKLPNLKIVGPVELSYKKRLDGIILKNKLTENIYILDPVYNISAKIELIDNAMLVVYPSYADAFPLTVIESYARGTCCIATAISETQYFIEFQEFLFEPGNLIDLQNKLKNFLLKQKELKEKVNYMQNKSRKYAEGAIVNDLLYEEIL